MIDLSGDDVLEPNEWSYYDAVLASRNGVLAIRPGAPGQAGDLTAPNTVLELPAAGAAASLAAPLRRRLLQW